MKSLLFVPLLVLVSLVPANSSAPNDLDEPCVMISYTTAAGSVYGSGVSFINDDIEFVWTAGHVVESAEKIETIVDPQTGESKVISSFDNVKVIKYIYNDEEKVGELIVFAEVIRYSDAVNGYDLALLKTKHKITKRGTEFFEEVVNVGQEVYFIGSPMGPPGYNSYITGMVAANKRGVSGFNHNTNTPIVNLDQYNLAITGGASGGPVFDLKSNRLMGLVVRAGTSQPSIAWAVPSKVIIKFAKENDCEWAITNKVKVPDNFRLRNPRTSIIK